MAAETLTATDKQFITTKLGDLLLAWEGEQFACEGFYSDVAPKLNDFRVHVIGPWYRQRQIDQATGRPDGIVYSAERIRHQ